jgi:hypothetical protein
MEEKINTSIFPPGLVLAVQFHSHPLELYLPSRITSSSKKYVKSF